MNDNFQAPAFHTGTVEYFIHMVNKGPREDNNLSWRECSKKHAPAKAGVRPARPRIAY